MAPKPKEIKQVPEATKDTEKNINIKEASNEELKQVADGIVDSPENQNQVKFFPDSWNSLKAEEKTKIAWQLTSEIQDSITELKDLWIEYSSDISPEDVDKVAALDFVIENKEKIPQLWQVLEKKADEVSKEIWKEIQDKWIIEK